MGGVNISSAQISVSSIPAWEVCGRPKYAIFVTILVDKVIKKSISSNNTGNATGNTTIDDMHNRGNRSDPNQYNDSPNSTYPNDKFATNHEELTERMYNIGADIVVLNGNLTKDDQKYIKFERRNISYELEFPIISDCQCSNVTSSCYNLSKYLNQSSSFNHSILGLEFYTNYSVLVYLCNEFGCGRSSLPTMFLSGIITYLRLFCNILSKLQMLSSVAQV